jgi:peroxiredoxin
MGPAVGEEAPDFTLRGGDRQFYTLSAYRGRRNVVLAFYVLAFTNG